MPIFTHANQWILETSSTAYALGINDAGLLVHSYWGKRLADLAAYPSPPNPVGWASFTNAAHLTPEEFPTYTGMKFTEPAMMVHFTDGVRDFVPVFERGEIEDGATPVLHLHLRDVHYPLRLSLHYRVHAATDLIERWASLKNFGVEPVQITRFFSACWHLPAGQGYHLSHLTGRWNDEFHLRQEELTHGVKVLESRRLTTSHHHNPWFTVDRGTTSEDFGEVWFGTLSWSGNWKLAAEVTDFDSARIHLGLNDWDFAWDLQPGETFTTPGSIAGYTQRGTGAASHALHTHIRTQVLPHGTAIHPILYNSWEATQFDVTESGQIKLTRLAASLGVELFFVDDGWFHGRTSDKKGLGDWWPDEHKFPHGLSPLIKEVNALGMDFGLWVEPEMVNPDSELYRANPDWIIHFPTRERSLGRNQCILNLGKPEVQDFIFQSLDNLLSQNNIRFIKWDMNRNVSEPGWQDAPGDPRELWVRYVQGLYHVWGTLRTRHPNVLWQSCSGGGGRADLGILRLADQIWPSDNTHPLERLRIQYGFSQLFPANVMEAWVTDMGGREFPLTFRFHVSMCGVLGLGADLTRWTEEDNLVAQQMISQYKEIRPIVQQGRQYRLHTPQGEGGFWAVEYLSGNGEAVLFAFNTGEGTRKFHLTLRGMDPSADYKVPSFTHPRSGAELMQSGVQVTLGKYQSICWKINRF